MISDPLARALRRFLLVQRSLCVAYTAAIAIYGVVAIILAHASLGFAEGTAVLVLPLSIGAGIVAAVSVSYRRWVYSDANLDRLLTRPIDMMRLAKQPPTGRLDEAFVAGLDALSKHEQRFVRLFADLQTPLVINLVLNEAIALIGLVLAVLQRNPRLLLPFATAGIVLNIWVWPTADRLYTRLQARLLAVSAT